MVNDLMKKLILIIVAVFLLSSCSNETLKPFTIDENNSESMNNYLSVSNSSTGEGKCFEVKLTGLSRVDTLEGPTYWYQLLLAPRYQQKLAITRITVMSDAAVPNNDFRFDFYPEEELMEKQEDYQAFRIEFYYTFSNYEDNKMFAKLDEIMKNLYVRIDYNLVSSELIKVSSVDDVENSRDDPQILEENRSLQNLTNLNKTSSGITVFADKGYPLDKYVSFQSPSSTELYAIEKLGESFDNSAGPFYLSGIILLEEAGKKNNATTASQLIAYANSCNKLYAVYQRDQIIALIIQKRNTDNYEWITDPDALAQMNLLAEKVEWTRGIEAYGGAIRYIRTADKQYFIRNSDAFNYREEDFFPDGVIDSDDVSDPFYINYNLWTRTELDLMK